jgi:outer membrane protein assembly factor BamA
MDETALVALHRLLGYGDATVTREAAYSRDGREVTFVFHINEGVRYRKADTVPVEGVNDVPVEPLEALIRMNANAYPADHSGIAVVNDEGEAKSPAAVTVQQASSAGRDVVSEVIVQGSRRAPAERIKQQIKTQVGKEYVPDTLREDARTLYATGQFGNVWVDARKDGHKVTVYVYLKDPGSAVQESSAKDRAPVVQKVSYKGNVSFTDDQLDRFVFLRKGEPLSPLANEVACTSICRRYYEKNRPFATCELLKGADADDTEVVFQISEGPKLRMRGVEFTGNKFVSAAVLRSHLLGTDNLTLADRDRDELIKYYRSFGYRDVKVSYELAYSGDRSEVTLVFHISEGVRHRLVDAAHVEGVKSVPLDPLEALTETKGNEYIDGIKLKQDASAIQDYHGVGGPKDKSGVAVVSPVKDILVTAQEANTGSLMFGVGVNSDTGVRLCGEPCQGHPDVKKPERNFDVKEPAAAPAETTPAKVSGGPDQPAPAQDPPARVGQIYVVGNERTPLRAILKRVPLWPGQVLIDADMRQAEKNLARLKRLKSAKVRVLDNPQDPDNPVKDVLIQVEE